MARENPFAGLDPDQSKGLFFESHRPGEVAENQAQYYNWLKQMGTDPARIPHIMRKAIEGIHGLTPEEAEERLMEVPMSRTDNPFMRLAAAPPPRLPTPGERSSPTGNEWLERKEFQRKFEDEPKYYRFEPGRVPEPYELPSHGRGYITQNRRR